MDIQFDFELQGGKTNHDPQWHLLTRELRKFIEGRLIVYNSEINEYPAGCIIVMFSTTQVRFYNFPEELAIKLKKCLVQEDFDYIFTKIYYLLNRQ